METITKENFISKLKVINQITFQSDMQTLHDFVMESTENGTNWNAYEEPDVRGVIDTYFSRLNDLLKSEQNHEPVKEKPKEAFSKKTSNQIKERKPIREKQSEPESEQEIVAFVERVPDEIRFLKRYLSLNGKKKTKEDFRRFINALQKAMIEKKIRKTSPYAKQINYIQDKLVKTFNSMARVVKVEISDRVVIEFKELISSEKTMPSVALIKRYLSLNGKYGVKEKAKLLLEAMKSAFEKGRIAKNDKYYKIFDLMHHNLSKYIKSKNQKVLSIVETELSGLNGIVGSTEEDTIEGTEGLDGLENIESDTEQVTGEQKQQTGVMSSMDFKKIRFDTIGFTGKYKDFIGDPSPGFTAMVFGRPKMGKSYLCIDFAGYLARNHGKVLYVAKEEGLDYTLQEKLKANDVAHPNLDISDTIPEDLNVYGFVFLDSVNSLGLSTDDLVALKEHNPGTSFIQVFQTTKAGSHRGDNESQHNVDVVIEVPEKGVAVQNGRFNQGGRMKIFNDDGFNEAA